MSLFIPSRRAMMMGAGTQAAAASAAWVKVWDAEDYGTYGTEAGWSGGYTVGVDIATGLMSNLGSLGTVTQARAIFRAAGSGYMNIADAYIGQRGAGAADFDGNQVQLTFASGTGYTMSANGEVATSDDVSFSWDKSTTLLIRSAWTNGDGGSLAVWGGGAATQSYYASGNIAGTTDVTMVSYNTNSYGLQELWLYG